MAGDFGWSVYPVGQNKAPLWSKRSEFPNGAKDASKVEATIDALWAPFPDALVAVRLDYSNLMAIDIDRHEGVNGLDSFWRLCKVLGSFDTTVAQTSLSGKGFHGLFKAPGFEIRKNLQGYAGIDFLHRHYIVLNEWKRGQSPWECELGKLPKAWGDALKTNPNPITRSALEIIRSDDPIRAISPFAYVRDLAGLSVNQGGFAQCPAHEDFRPSLKVYEGDGGWYCYQCERGGSIYDFAALVMGLPRDWGNDSIQSAHLIDAVWRVYERLWDVRSEY